jgi:hypothetical protein
MAPLQSSLTRFRFESKVPKEDIISELIAPSIHGDTNDVATEAFQIPIIEVVANSAGSNPSKPLEPAKSSQIDCILLNVLSTAIPIPKRVPDMEIVDPVVATPLQGSGIGNMNTTTSSKIHGLHVFHGQNQYWGVIVVSPKFDARPTPSLRDVRNC